MKPFNLEKALVGDQVVTRLGKKVTKIKMLDNSPETRPIAFAVDDGQIYFCDLDGFVNKSQHDYDIFMDEK